MALSVSDKIKLMNILKCRLLKSKLFIFPRISTGNITGIATVRFQHDMSYWHNPGSEPLKQLTVGNLVDKAAERWKEDPGLISAHQGSVLSFGEIKKQVDQLAQGLLEIGLTAGDRLGIWGINSKEWYLTLLAAAKIGIISVVINPVYQLQELAYCIKKTKVKALAIDVSFKSQKYYDIITNLVPEISKTKPRNSFHNSEYDNFTHLIVFSNDEIMGAYNLPDLFLVGNANEEKRKAIEKKLQAESIWNIQFTSGTTGNPKGAALTHFSNVNNAYFLGKRLGYHTKKHYICCQVPLFHAFGTDAGIISALVHGVTLVLSGPKYNVQDSMKTIKDYKCTVLYGTPTMYVDLCAEIDKISKEDPEVMKQFNCVEIAVTAGALCSPELFTKLQSLFGCKVTSVYGMTEAGPATFQSTLNDTVEQMTTTVGTVSESCEVKVVDKEGNVVPLGEPGEVWFRSYGTMECYWEDEERTKESITNGRWLKSGDQFRLLRGGYGQVIGRIKDMIIRGGENIAPKEIEYLLETHPSILEVQVYGVSSHRLGEEISCSIKLKEGATLNEKDIQNFCQGKIAPFKIPKYIEFVSEFPKTASGKIKKFELKRLMENKINRK
ncbi:medium-chain acyl-CoA ligase ACSF2, mitochondrial-like [Lycorma delicatula]|uniref:medium-chain acyl-CoA ligase ACSF2, mitochondrial-like n=1 Tax=Lycorma delicatula TaxID=130591 RepID=UPI003F50E0EB